MDVVCPCCKATNNSVTCRRCRADLKLIAAGEEFREYQLVLFRRYLADRRYADADRCLTSAESIRSDRKTSQYRAALALLNTDYQSAMFHAKMALADSHNQLH